MPTIKTILRNKPAEINSLDLEILLAKAINQSREFVLTHPEYHLTKIQHIKFHSYISARVKLKPLAQIIKEKEFYNLNFIVNKHTLIPRPETELLVEEVLQKTNQLADKHSRTDCCLLDVGTGSGNIIISLVKNIPFQKSNLSVDKFIAIDISGGALRVAKKNARQHKIEKRIVFLKGNLLKPFLKKYSEKPLPKNLIISANLPYLSKKIYHNCDDGVKLFEPKTALYSPNDGLQHYENLLKQLRDSTTIKQKNLFLFLEISPEQKNLIEGLIKKYFPQAKIIFKKDLAGKWRLCNITIKQ